MGKQDTKDDVSSRESFCRVGSPVSLQGVDRAWFIGSVQHVFEEALEALAKGGADGRRKTSMAEVGLFLAEAAPGCPRIGSAPFKRESWVLALPSSLSHTHSLSHSSCTFLHTHTPT